jgi:hypothetical protein
VKKDKSVSGLSLSVGYDQHALAHPVADVAQIVVGGMEPADAAGVDDQRIMPGFDRLTADAAQAILELFDRQRQRRIEIEIRLEIGQQRSDAVGA